MSFFPSVIVITLCACAALRMLLFLSQTRDLVNDSSTPACMKILSTLMTRGSTGNEYWKKTKKKLNVMPNSLQIQLRKSNREHKNKR